MAHHRNSIIYSCPSTHAPRCPKFSSKSVQYYWSYQTERQTNTGEKHDLLGRGQTQTSKTVWLKTHSEFIHGFLNATTVNITEIKYV